MMTIFEENIPCGSCYRSYIPTARHYICLTCLQCASECQRCVELGQERQLSTIFTCAACGLAEDIAQGDATDAGFDSA
jgi:hypothetical protein